VRCALNLVRLPGPSEHHVAGEPAVELGPDPLGQGRAQGRALWQFDVEQDVAVAAVGFGVIGQHGVGLGAHCFLNFLPVRALGLIKGRIIFLFLSS